MARLSRVRIEALGADAKEVSLLLADVAGEIKGKHGGEWEEEDPGTQTLAATKGTWGRLTIRRKDDET